jgi:hypothetical protein
MKNIRKLSLAVLAVVALLALPSAASAAGGIGADSYPADLETTAIDGFTATIPAQGSIECQLNTLSGELGAPAATYGLAGSGWCSGGGSSQPIQMNNCELEFEPGSQTLAVGPEACSGIDMVLGACQIKVTPQAGISATQVNASGDVAIEVNDNSINYSVAKTIGGCPVGKGSYTNLSWSGLQLNVAGYDELQLAPVDLVVATSGLPPVGVFMSEGLFDAQVFPVRYQAAPAPSGQLKVIGGLPIGSAYCEAGASTLAESSASLKFTEFSGCTFKTGNGPYSATVRANSCSYEFNGSVGVSCAKEGDKIEIEIPSLCTVTVPAQSLSGSSYTPKNEGGGATATIAVNSAATGVKSGKVKTLESQTACAFFPSSGTNGQFAANVILSGSYAG